MDESNQYWQAMTKPLPYGCIKKQEHPLSLLEFSKIMDKISHEDKIRYILIVDITCHDKNPKTLVLVEKKSFLSMLKIFISSLKRQDG